MSAPSSTSVLPTSNPVAEAAIIAGLVNCGDPAAIGRYALEHRLNSECFTISAFRAAYAVIVDLAADGQPVDLPILAQLLDKKDLVAVDSACHEHVSAANFTHYAQILTDCKRCRAEAAARERLIQFAAAGAPDHELTAIVESIRMASAGEASKDRFTAVNALCDLPPSDNWLIKRYLPADSLTVMFGSPGCGKSFLAIDLACHVATDRDWRGQPVKAGRVVYIAGEGKNGLAKRFRAWFDHHSEQPRNISLLLTPIALTDPAAVASLVTDIRALPEPPALVVIDTLNRNFGPGDENSTADMTRAVAGLDAIRTATGAAILGVHHSGHAEKGRGRGSSVLFGAVDAEYATEMNGNTVQVRATKMKDADTPPPLAWTLKKQFLPWCDDEGEPLDSAVLSPADVQACPATSRHLSDVQRIAMDALRAALMAHGTEDKGVVTVSEEEWRQAAYSAGIASSDTTQDAKRKAFNRARKALISAKAVSCYEERYWIPYTRIYPDKTGHCPDMSGGMLDGQTGQDRTHPYKGCPGVRVSGIPGQAEPEADIATQPAELPTKPLSPLGRRIMKTVQATPAGLDTNELGRQVGNGKGASSLMVERELEELVRRRLVAKTNGRWVTTRVQS